MPEAKTAAAATEKLPMELTNSQKAAAVVVSLGAD